MKEKLIWKISLLKGGIKILGRTVCSLSILKNSSGPACIKGPDGSIPVKGT
jgi:hypothetical protein